jgi:hypothetical protein
MSDDKSRPHPGRANDRVGGQRLPRLVRDHDDKGGDERVDAPFYDHLEGSDELRQALKRVQKLLADESLIGPAERARQNAEAVVTDLLDGLRGDLHGRPGHETTRRIDRVASAIKNRDIDTIATISLIQAIIDESRRFDASGSMPDYSMSCPESMEKHLSTWPERWMDLPADKFIAAAKAWAEVERGGNPSLWIPIAEAISAARLPKRKPETLRRLCRKWEEDGLLRR